MMFRVNARAVAPAAQHCLRAAFHLLRPCTVVSVLTLAVIAQAVAEADGAAPLDFAEAQRMALTEQPLLESQARAVEAARESAVAASQLPDPKLSAGLIDWPVTGVDRYSLSDDDFTMIAVGVSQDFPRAAKRRRLAERGEHETHMAQAMLDATRLVVAREAGLAWLDVWEPTRAMELLRASVRESELQLQAMQAAYASVGATQADVLAAQVTLALMSDELADAEQRDRDARAQLSRWIGPEALQRPLSSALPSWKPPAPLAESLVHLRLHPHLDTETQRVALANDEVALARQAYKPDWGMELAYGYRADFADFVTLNFTVGLPFFTANRQDRSLSATIAEQEQAKENAQDVQRQHEADLRRHLEGWQRLQARLGHFDTDVLPQSEQRIAAALAAWQAGEGTLLAVLDARRLALENRLKRLALEADAARHRVEIQYFAGEQP